MRFVTSLVLIVYPKQNSKRLLTPRFPNLNSIAHVYVPAALAVFGEER